MYDSFNIYLLAITVMWLRHLLIMQIKFWGETGVNLYTLYYFCMRIQTVFTNTTYILESLKAAETM